MNIDDLLDFVFSNIEGSYLIINSPVKEAISIEIKANTCLRVFVFHNSNLLFWPLFPNSHIPIVSHTSN